MGHLSRVRSRRQLDMFRAFAAANAGKDDARDEWVKEQMALAGWD